MSASTGRRLAPSTGTLRVLVLGGGSDIAAATVATWERSGRITVIVAARDCDAAITAMAMAAPGAELIGRPWDALDVDGHASFIHDVFDRHGPIDVVLCAVGKLGHHAGLSMGPNDVDLMLRSNFSGPAAALSAVGERFAARGNGTIVVLSSVAGARARKSNFVYGSAKAGLDSFAQGMGDALAEHGVSVVIVRPGFVRSKMTTGLKAAPFSSDPHTVAAAIVEATASGRSRIVWVPPVLGVIMGALRIAPRSVWRRVAGNR